MPSVRKKLHSWACKKLMPEKTVLVLEDGRVFEGSSFGAEAAGYGEVVFDSEGQKVTAGM